MCSRAVVGVAVVVPAVVVVVDGVVPLRAVVVVVVVVVVVGNVVFVVAPDVSLPTVTTQLLQRTGSRRPHRCCHELSKKPQHRMRAHFPLHHRNRNIISEEIDHRRSYT